MSLLSKFRKRKSASPLSADAQQGGNAFFTKSTGSLASKNQMGQAGTRVDDLLAGVVPVKDEDLEDRKEPQTLDMVAEPDVRADEAPQEEDASAGETSDLDETGGDAREMHDTLSREFEAEDLRDEHATDPVNKTGKEPEASALEDVEPQPMPMHVDEPSQAEESRPVEKAEHTEDRVDHREEPQPRQTNAEGKDSAEGADNPQSTTCDSDASDGGIIAVSTSGENGALSNDVRKTSRAQLDMEAMKKAPDLKSMVRRDVMAGSIAVGVFLIFLVGWSALAPLSSAAIAPGVISPQGSRKTVQHLEGGIIEKILVEEGSEVKAGDALVLLEDTMARASYDLIRTQYYTLAARVARLAAQQDGLDSVTFPSWLMEEAKDPKVNEILVSERHLLQTALAAHSDRKAVLNEKIGQLEKEIEGVQSQIGGQKIQLELIAEEVRGVQELLDKGLERKPRLLALQRNEADIRARQGANVALIAKTEQAIGATELELLAADTVMQDEVAKETAEVQASLSAAGEKMAASGDILKRIEIRAPVSGRVIDLNYHTAGGIIGPGSDILDIVPENEDLLIEARVSPMDIDVVYESLEAQIHLTAFSQRNLPMIEGRVRHVSADRHVDQVTGQPYFLATVEIMPEEVAKIGEGVTLMPGMPAEVMIVTGEKTLLGYLAGPAISTMRKSFRES